MASIGATGGITGSFIGSLSRVVGEGVVAGGEPLSGIGASNAPVLESLLELDDIAPGPG